MCPPTRKHALQSQQKYRACTLPRRHCNHNGKHMTNGATSPRGTRPTRIANAAKPEQQTRQCQGSGPRGLAARQALRVGQSAEEAERVQSPGERVQSMSNSVLGLAWLGAQRGGKRDQLLGATSLGNTHTHRHNFWLAFFRLSSLALALSAWVGWLVGWWSRMSIESCCRECCRDSVRVPCFLGRLCGGCMVLPACARTSSLAHWCVATWRDSPSLFLFSSLCWASGGVSAGFLWEGGAFVFRSFARKGKGRLSVAPMRGSVCSGGFQFPCRHVLWHGCFASGGWCVEDVHVPASLLCALGQMCRPLLVTTARSVGEGDMGPWSSVLQLWHVQCSCQTTPVWDKTLSAQAMSTISVKPAHHYTLSLHSF